MDLDENILNNIQKALNVVHASPDLEQRASVLLWLARAHKQAEISLRSSGPGPYPEEQELALVMSALREHAAADGSLVGVQEYDDLDPGWVESLLKRIAAPKVPFPTHGPGELPTIPIPNSTRLAMVGDWGTGDPSSLAIAHQMAVQQTPYTIHLGDVYYAGTEEECRQNFVAPWPVGSTGSLTLNSNHEMYSGGKGYFTVNLQSPKFALQRGLSYFALENAQWIIVGLDSAYYAEDYLFQHGHLDDAVQLPLLRSLGQRARAQGKGLILLSHHQGITETGAFEPLWQQVTQALADGPETYYWYWGHIHAAIVHNPVQVGHQTVYGRCVGHGGIPYAAAKSLTSGATPVTWFESAVAGDPREPARALNGFAVLRLEGSTLSEQLFSEYGNLRWPV